MTDATAYRCTECNEPVTLRRRQWDNGLIAACECKNRAVRIARKSPEGWVNDE